MQFRHLLVITLIFITSIGLVNAQTHTTTPAPSKTPTTTRTQSPLSENIASHTPLGKISTEISRYNQEDLSILTGNVQRPNGAIWFNDKLYMACTGDWTLYELDDTTGSTITYIYGIRNTHSMYVESLDNAEMYLWVPDFDTNSLMRVNRNRSPETIARELEGPWGITAFDEENFLLTNLLGNNISLVSRTGEVQNIVEELRSPTGIAADEESVYFANNGSSRRAIEWFEKDTVGEDEVISPQPLVSGIQSVTGLTLGSDEYLYFAYSLGTRGVVGRVMPSKCQENGGCTNADVEVLIYTELAAPLAGLTISPDMRLFVHTIFKPEVYWVQLES